MLFCSRDSRRKVEKQNQTSNLYKTKLSKRLINEHTTTINTPELFIAVSQQTNLLLKAQKEKLLKGKPRQNTDIL